MTDTKGRTHLHRNIKGVDSRGRAYHSLQPQVYGWVHTVFLDSMVTMYALYGTPLTHALQCAARRRRMATRTGEAAIRL